MTTNPEVREAAERVVNRLLDDYGSAEDYESRPGGSKDPHRQTTMKMKFGKKDFSGKRGTEPAKGEDEDEESKPGSRFKMKFGEAKSKSRGAVAKAPGNVKRQKGGGGSAPKGSAIKGGGSKSKPTVAKTPGKVKHEDVEDELPTPDELVQHLQDAPKIEGRARRLLNAIARPPA